MAKKSNFNFNDLSTWPMVFSLVLGLAFAGLLVFLIKSLLVDNVTQQVESKNSAIVKEENEYKKNKKLLAILPLLKKEVAELEKVRDEAKKYLPEKEAMPALIENVYLAARNNGIIFKTFTPGKDEDRPYYTIKPISLSAEVGYISMSSFIEEVTTLKRIMNVESVTFEAADIKAADSKNANQPLTMTAQLRTYIFKDNLSLDKGK